MNTVFYIRFADIVIRFEAPFSIEVPLEFQAFLIPEEKADECFRIELIDTPLQLPEEPVFCQARQSVYALEDGWLRVFHGISAEGCTAACRLRTDGRHTIYFPWAALSQLQQKYRMASMICGEHILFRHNAILLHSSVLIHEGKSILFCGPSGIGKSTQAALWERHLGAKIINGDRCAIRNMSGTFFGGGSPWCGSSGIYDPTTAPICAVVILGQGSENILRPAEEHMAFRMLYSQCAMNTWDTGYVVHACDLIQELQRQLPVYELICRPEESAVLLLRDALFSDACISDVQCP